MRKTLVLLAVTTALATAPAASPAGDPVPGCETFGRGVASATAFWRGNGGFGQEVVRLVGELGGNPLEPNRATDCA